MALAFSAGLTWYGSEIVETALLLDERSSTGLQFPMWIYDLALPAGGALMVSRYLIRIYRFSFRYDPETMALGYAIHETPLDLAQRTGD